MSTYTITQHKLNRVTPHEYLSYLQIKHILNIIQNSTKFPLNIRKKLIEYLHKKKDDNLNITFVKITNVEVSINYQPRKYINETTHHTRIINGEDITSVLYFNENFIPCMMPEFGKNGDNINYMLW